MGRIGRLLSFVFTKPHNDIQVADVKIDPGAGANYIAQHFAPPGDDSQPLPGDWIYSAASRATGGRGAVLGYVDKIDSQAQPGEKRIYARDPATGLEVAQVRIENDGTITLSNANGSIVLQAGGIVAISGTLTADKVVAATSLTVGGVEVGSHTHGGVTPGGGTTAPLV